MHVKSRLHEPSLLERKVLYFKRPFLSNHLPVFVGYFIAMSFLAVMCLHVCAVSYEPSLLEKKVIFFKRTFLSNHLSVCVG